MNLTKAIEIKLQWRKDNYPTPLADEFNADMLSIEALERINAIRNHQSYSVYPSLPGETKE